MQKFKKPKITWDSEYGLLYANFRETRKTNNKYFRCQSIELKSGTIVVLDIGDNEELLGVEVIK